MNNDYFAKRMIVRAKRDKNNEYFVGYEDFFTIATDSSTDTDE